MAHVWCAESWLMSPLPPASRFRAPPGNAKKREARMPYFVGIDCGKTFHWLNAITPDSKVVLNRRVENTADEI